MTVIHYLLNEAREFSERIIDILYPRTPLTKKPRTYRHNARRDFLSLVKQRLAETELGDFVYTLSRKPRPDPTIEALTEREREIAEAVGRGLQNKEIAAELNISKHTVSSHLRRIFRKLRVHSRTAVGTYMAEKVA